MTALAENSTSTTQGGSLGTVCDGAARSIAKVTGAELRKVLAEAQAKAEEKRMAADKAAEQAREAFQAAVRADKTAAVMAAKVSDGITSKMESHNFFENAKQMVRKEWDNALLRRLFPSLMAQRAIEGYEVALETATHTAPALVSEARRAKKRRSTKTKRRARASAKYGRIFCATAVAHGLLPKASQLAQRPEARCRGRLSKHKEHDGNCWTVQKNRRRIKQKKSHPVTSSNTCPKCRKSLGGERQKDVDGGRSRALVTYPAVT